MAEDLGDKTEDPTARRLTEARNNGQIPRSTDLNAVISLIAAAFLVAFIAGPAAERGSDLMRRSLTSGFAGTSLGTEQFMPMVQYAAHHALHLLWPVGVVGVIVAIVSNWIQSSPTLTVKPLQPKLSKLNPISGVKRIFGIRGVVKTGMGLLKLSVVGLIAIMMTSSKLPKLTALSGLSYEGVVMVMARLVAETIAVLLAVLLLIALIDYLYQKWQHRQDLKMTKQEVKDERKSLDGDPDIKRRRMRMMAELAQQRVEADVPDADVIVTNPTHFSVALKYAEGWRAPKVVAKGGDHLAFRIRAIAVTAGVPVVERPPLARALYWNTEIGQEISPAHYEAVAEVLAYVYRLDAEANRQNERAPIQSGTTAGATDDGGGDA